LIEKVLCDQGTCVFASNGVIYDLQPLAGRNFQVTMGMYVFSFFPCSNDCLGPGGNSGGLCQNDLMSNYIAIVSIWDSTMQWSTFTSQGLTGVQYTTANGAPPLCSPSNKPRFATIQFVCQPSGPSTFSVVTEPNLQGCSVAPGYVFQLTTPYACADVPPPPVCSYLVDSPCVISTFNQYAWADGLSLDLNQDSNACGKLVFSDYIIKPQPADTCTNSSIGYRMIGHMDILMFPKILKMLQSATAQNPVLYFWDVDTNSAAIGPTNGTFRR